MSSMKDALREEIARIKRLLDLIAEDPKMEDTIRKFATATPSVNGGGRTRASRSTETPITGFLAEALKFVEQHGPSTRQEIMTATRIAPGSFTHFIRDSGKFTHREDGRWELKK